MITSGGGYVAGSAGRLLRRSLRRRLLDRLLDRLLGRLLRRRLGRGLLRGGLRRRLPRGRLARRALRRPGGPLVGQELRGALEGDLRNLVALAQGGVRRAVGDIGAEPAVLD